MPPPVPACGRPEASRGGPSESTAPPPASPRARAPAAPPGPAGRAGRAARRRRRRRGSSGGGRPRSEEHTSELQSLAYLVCRLLLEKKKKKNVKAIMTIRRHH